MGIHMAKLAKMKKISSDDPIPFDQIPFDLIPEILKGLPVKTLARFLCVSKQYASIIRDRHFMKSYLIKSSTRPQDHLIFTFCNIDRGRHFFFSASFSVATYPKDCCIALGFPSVHGLICDGPSTKPTIYNPSTRRTISLPKMRHYFVGYDPTYYVGYDPIDFDYKVLSITQGIILIFTLGKDISWRTIEENFLPQRLCWQHICIDGVLYFAAFVNGDQHFKVMSFDVRSEKFHLIETPTTVPLVDGTKLTKYEGKLAIICSTSDGYFSFKKFIPTPTCRVRVDMWVLENAAKHEWSEKVFDFQLWNIKADCLPEVFCLTDAKEFVLAPTIPRRKEPFYVIYYDPEKKTRRKVYIEGISELMVSGLDGEPEGTTVSIFSGQVDNLMFL